MPAQLVSLGEGPNILVDKPILLLGRHPECDIQIESRKISRRHCCIAQVNDYLVVRDLDSTNGIRINGVRVLEGQLHDGDEVTIGGSRYRVTWDDNPPPHVAAHAPRPPLDPDDSDLEECDEPVPLIDTARGQPQTARPPKAPAQTVDEKPGPPILPSDLDLVPRSGPPKPP
jgi:predicted component of type VI protein secretion system